MALIKNSLARDLARDAVVLDLGDLRRQADALTAHARAEAEGLLDQARAEREHILDGAADQGRRQGHAEGLAEGRKAGAEEGRAAAVKEIKPRLDALEAAWSAALGAFALERDDLLSRAQRDVLRLAVCIAERVTKRAVRLDPAVAAEQLRAVLSLVVRPTELVVSINPADRSTLDAALPSLAAAFPAVRHVELRDDAALSPGSVVARTRAESGANSGPGSGRDGVGGEIDASIETQLDRIIEAILPDRRVAPAPVPEPGPAAPEA